ncbi:MAG: GNAT family N-acetyltransferase [Desulfobacterales bacterium]
MIEVSVCRDLREAKRHWQRHWPQQCLFDLWPVRACFQAEFNNSPYFLIASRRGSFCGMLALSWIDEKQCFGHFPGELWEGKTWLEQNKIPASDPAVAGALLDQVPAAAKIRYLTQPPGLAAAAETVDEIGYLFFPGQYDYCFPAYLQSFSGKSRKKMRVELDRLKARGVSWRHDNFADVDRMFRLNLENFKEYSYFSDDRFLRAFENLASWLQAKDLLRVTTVLIGGEVAAVDIGAVRGATYTVLAGGTHPEFAGVAKLINLHHLEWACRQRFAEVDFLCGEFNWKNRFHLTPRPLFQVWNQQAQDARPTVAAPAVACAA